MSIELTSRPGSDFLLRNRVRIVVVFVFAIIPLTFLQNRVLGFQLSGWAWLLVLAATAPLVLTEPLSPRAVRLLLPYLAFLLYAAVSLAWVQDFHEGVATLVQFTVPVLAYLLAWRVPDSSMIRDRLRVMSLRGIGLAVVVTVVFFSGLDLRLGLDLSPRPMSISLAVLFVVATLESRSWRYTTAVAVVALLIAAGVGSRLSSAVILVMLLISPSLGIRWQGRVAMAIACLLLVLAVSQTEAFRQRFFFSDEATLRDVFTLSDQLNTAGRRELWPELVKQCSPTSMTGLGIGASGRISAGLSRTLDQPHNEYLRAYCDEGWIGSALLWGFLALTAIRSWRRAADGGEDASLHASAGNLILALLLFGITDNPMTYTAHFMAPMAVILGLSDKAAVMRRSHPRPAASTRPRPPMAPVPRRTGDRRGGVRGPAAGSRVSGLYRHR